jgi:hypothetical protein
VSRIGVGDGIVAGFMLIGDGGHVCVPARRGMRLGERLEAVCVCIILRLCVVCFQGGAGRARVSWKDELRAYLVIHFRGGWVYGCVGFY